MKTYNELKEAHQKEVNDFTGIFFAFNNDQFREGMEKIGLTESDTDKIFSLGFGGGYILKSKSKEFAQMFKRHNAELKEFKKNEKQLFDALVYELDNHEYGYTGDPTDALDALGLTINNVDPALLKKATAAAYHE